MTKQTEPQPKIVNPRYAGATPAMVARALMRKGSGEKPEESRAAAETGDGEGF